MVNRTVNHMDNSIPNNTMWSLFIKVIMADITADIMADIMEIMALCQAISFQATAPAATELDSKITSVASHANSAYARNARERDSRKRRESHARSPSSRRTNTSTMVEDGIILVASTSISVAAIAEAPGLGRTDDQTKVRTIIQTTYFKFIKSIHFV